MEIEKLFKGIAVVIDDQVNEEDSSISKIVKFLKEKNIPVVTYDEIPNEDIIDSLQDASFIILDWEYNKIGDLVPKGDERLALPPTLGDDSKEELLSFIKQIMDKIFVPVFIFTDQEPNSIDSTLKARGFYTDEKPSRIFIKRKSELRTYDELIGAIKGWIQRMPSVYILKKWEEALNTTKNKMFIEMYGYSANWVNIIWNLLKEDNDKEYSKEFGDFVTRNLVNRMECISFDENYIAEIETIPVDELTKVLEGERYIAYGDVKPEIPYTGDLFKDGQKYYLNIRAQCDLVRNTEAIMYCIEGEEFTDGEIVTNDINLTKQGVLKLNSKEYSISQLQDATKSNKKLKGINYALRKYCEGRVFSNGAIIERAPEVFVACIDGKKIIKFTIEINTKKFTDEKDKRIGRILPPYITRIQQKCAQHIIREGTIPLPQAIFK